MPNGQSVDCGGGTATLSGDGDMLTLDNATIIMSPETPSPYALWVENGDLRIELVGKNRIDSVRNSGVGVFGTDLTFSGDGSLSIEAAINAVEVGNGSVTVDGCGIDVLSKNHRGLFCSYGARPVLSIRNGADVTVESKEEAIFANGGMSISDSTVTATSNGSGTGVVYSDMDIQISNSTVSATGTGAGPAIYANAGISIMDESDVTATSEGICGIHAGGDMVIHGSTVTAEGTTYKGMFVLGSLTINDSTVTATGCPDSATSAIDTNNLTIVGASDVTCDGGVNVVVLDVHADQDSLMDVMVGASVSEAQHFDGGGVTSPLRYRIILDSTEGGVSALDLLKTYDYVRIGAHAHVFDQKVTSDSYLASAATCERAATYRYSCVCEEAGTDTFASGDPLGHEWGKPAWVWAEDYSEATATFTCQRDASHTQAETVKAMSEVTTPATCTEDGATTYTASVSFNGQQYRDVKEAADVPALGHDWGEPAWSWAEDYSSATATFACRRDASHTRELAAEVTSVTTDPTATEAGSTVYTASVELGGSGYADTRTVIIPATGAAGDEPGHADDPDDGQADGGTQTGGEDGEGATAQGDDEAEGTALPKTGDSSGIAPLLASALAAASACGGILAWRRSRKAA